MASVRWGCVYAIFLSNPLAALCGGMPTYLCYAIFVAVLLPCCRRLYTCLNVVRCTIFYHAAAGFAIDRLEGDGINKPVASPHNLGKRWLSFGTAATQKNICVGSCVSAIFFCGACGVGYLT